MSVNISGVLLFEGFVDVSRASEINELLNRLTGGMVGMWSGGRCMVMYDAECTLDEKLKETVK